MHKSKKAVILLSGGLDSATTAALAKNEGFRLYCLSFDYGQRHRHELAAAQKVATHLGAEKHLVMPLGLRALGGSALTADLAVPKDRDTAQMAAEIPITYVPARNTIFLALALGWAEVLGAGDIFIGANAVDFSGYPDCRPAFLTAFEALANLAIKEAVEGRLHIRLRAPLMHMTKAQIIRTGLSLSVDYRLTHSCYDPSPEGLACGRCDSCLLRSRGFAEAGIPDPTPYQS